MNIFLGFVAGILIGFISGAFGMAVLSIVSTDVRDAIIKQSERVNIHW